MIPNDPGTWTVRRADTGEGEILRAIAAAAKGYWGYDRERVAEWAAKLDLAPATLREHEHYVAEAAGGPVAFMGLHEGRPVSVLDHLWVMPGWIGHEIGRDLFALAVSRATALGASWLEWEADPNAVGFYERMGGRYLRPSPQTEWGRTLPIMGLRLPSATSGAGAEEPPIGPS